MYWEEVKDVKTLAKIKTVEEMLPTPAKNQTHMNEPRIGEEQYKILEEMFRLDCTVEVACMHAWISVPSYYVHINKDPDLALRMSRAREFPKLVARAAIQRRIRQWDSKTALEYLKLRDKNYREDALEEESFKEKMKVEFTLVPSKDKWAEDQQKDSPISISASSASEWYASSWERQTPWENEEEALKRLASLSSNSE